MRSTTHSPHPSLRHYVQLIWCFEADEGDACGPPERITPDGIVEWVVHYRGATTARFGQESFSRLPPSSLVCQGTRYLDVSPQGPVGFISVRFFPWGALHFFDVPVDELSDQIVAADQVWPRASEALCDCIAEAADRRQRVAIVERYLLDRLRRFQKPDVREALEAVWRAGGTVSVPVLCHELGLSTRTAHRVFRRSVGMPPKRYARLVRFLTACSMIRRTRSRTLGEIAHRCGYYDQAHFGADFQSFAGMSPGDFVSAASVSFLEID